VFSSLLLLLLLLWVHCFVVRMYLIAEFDCSSQAMVGISSGMSSVVLSGNGYESWKFFV
jgi:hypothetical protein